jgi:long-chain acyl-CoA synthetase
MSIIVRGPDLDPRLRELTGETLVELLDRAVARAPDRETLVLHHALGDLRWTARELQRRSRSAAAVLAASGVRHGDRVVTWAPNDPWLVAAMFGCWRLGAVLVPLDLRMAEGTALRIARRAEPVLVLAAQAQHDGAHALGVPVLPLDGETLDRAIADVPPGSADPMASVAPDDLAEIVFTSGTSSDPKGVALTHAQVIHAARMIAQTGMGERPDRALGIIPLSHLYGQIVPLFMGLVSGSALVFVPSLTPNAIGAALRRERITAITAVPQLLRLLLDGIEAEARRQGAVGRLERARRIARFLPMSVRRRLFRSVHDRLGGHLDVITSGGALLEPDLQAGWELMGVRIVQGYGSSECAAITGHSRASRRPGTVGSVLAGLEVSFADDGELRVRGPAVMDGYWRDPDATAAVLDADGWLATGDAARIEPNGEVVILGRTRDRIALPNGLKVYPEDLEAALCATGIIRVAVAFEAAPSRIVAVLVPTDASTDDATLAAAVKAANAGLAAHQRIATWRRWPDPDVPRTHTLKVRRGPIRDWYLSGDAGPLAEAAGSAGGAATRTMARTRLIPRRQAAAAAGIVGSAPGAGDPVERVCTILAESLAPAGSAAVTITADQPLADLALDSLARVAIGLRIEEELGASLTDQELADARTARHLAMLAVAATGRPVPAPPSTWATTSPARLFRRISDATVTGALLHVVARPRVVGLDHLAGLEGPILVCPNHASHLDVPCVRFALPRERRDRTAVAAAADYFFTNRILGPSVALAMGAFPFGRTSDVRASLERVADLLADDWSVILFPEGTRSPDGRLGPMRDGIGLLATAAAVPVVPVHLDGTHRILPKGRSVPRRRHGDHVTIRFGEPLRFPPDAPAHAVATAIGDAIAALGREAVRGASTAGR